MDGCVIYFGNDENFKTALSASAESLGFSFQDCSHWENVSPRPQYPYLIILDADSDTKYSDLKWDFLPDTTPLLVIAAQNSQQAETVMQNNFPADVTDVFIKSYQPQILSKKLDFYLASSPSLPAQSKPQHAIQPPSATQETKTPREKKLLQKLQRADSLIDAQNKVLEKIRQVSRLSKRINCLDLDTIASICIEEIPPLIACRFASLYQFDSDKGILHLLRHNHPYPIDRLLVLSEHEESPMTAAFRMKKLLVIKDLVAITDTHDLTVNRLFARNYRSNSCIIAPLLSGDNILGVLNLADKIDAPCFESTNDLLPMQLLCDIIGSAMSNIRLFDEVRHRARTDSMTGLYNHRAFYDELEKEVRRSRRYSGNLSLIIIDLDNLKQINDQHGHRAGDAVILHTAKQISRCIREFDIASRYGGDEFAIILPNTLLQDAETVGRRLLQMVSEKSVKIDHVEITASISVGICQYQGDSIEDFMNESDTALFDAKTAGKNRIHIFDPAQK